MNRHSNSSNSIWSSPWVFFGFALGFSWLVWFLLILLGISVATPLGRILGLLGLLLGPALAGIISFFSKKSSGTVPNGPPFQPSSLANVLLLGVLFPPTVCFDNFRE